MSNITFITSNQGKADFLARFLNHPVEHMKVEMDEVQSLDLHEVTLHKAKQAYQVVKSPVLVEDVAFSFAEWGGKLPGAFMKWFLEAMGPDGVAALLKEDQSREAYGQICYVYYDGNKPVFFDGEVKGSVADHPRGEGGFGWDYIFIPDGSDKTYSEMNDKELEKFSLRTTTVYPRIREFLAALDKA